jgi:hypothetical protein
MLGGSPWTERELADVWMPWAVFGVRYPLRSRDAWRNKRQDLSRKGLRPRLDTPPDMPPVAWDKHEVDFHWTDVLKPLTELQQIAKAASGSQDRAHFHLQTDAPAPVLFVSDWHIGSWGTSYQAIAEITQTIRDRKLWVVALGDMLQMAIKLRNVLEISDNALPPRLQMRFLQSWLEDIAPYVLWSTWDNHSVMREETATGFSQYAELFKEKTVYHSGIGHVDLTVGEETYRVCSSHRFSGNSHLNPTHGQMRYMRFEGIDREIAIAGDSHRPAVQTYTDGPQPRIAVNVGTLQTDSGYAKRHFSLSTHDWMPVVVFFPDRHLMVPFPSLTHYLATRVSATPIPVIE